MSESERGSVTFGATTIDYVVTRSTRRRKTVEITIDPAEGVLVAAPAGTTAERIREVVHGRAAWIVRQWVGRAAAPGRKEFVSGESLPYLGRQVRLVTEQGDVASVRVRFRHWEFHVTTPVRLAGEARREAVRRALVRWYRRRARERLAERVERWAAVAGYRPAGMLIREQRGRWGSANAAGLLRFNWRIAMAEPALMDYVIVHELAHLRARTHSPEFWAEVGRLMPDYGLRRARLREVGAGLVL